MNGTVVMDTNVAVVANGEAGQATPDCVTACIDQLLLIREQHRTLLDENGLILDEYRRYLSPSGQPGPGDAFFKWLWDNQANSDHCLTVRITPDVRRDFVEFPDDSELVGFDRSDRKFVAVSLASGLDPTLLNASDTDWWEYRVPLQRHGIRIRFLCPDLMVD